MTLTPFEPTALAGVGADHPELRRAFEFFASAPVQQIVTELFESLRRRFLEFPGNLEGTDQLSERGTFVTEMIRERLQMADPLADMRLNYFGTLFLDDSAGKTWIGDLHIPYNARWAEQRFINRGNLRDIPQFTVTPYRIGEFIDPATAARNPREAFALSEWERIAAEICMCLDGLYCTMSNAQVIHREDFKRPEAVRGNLRDAFGMCAYLEELRADLELFAPVPKLAAAEIRERKLVFETPLEAVSYGPRDIRLGARHACVELLQNQGTAPRIEDVAVLAYPFFGVGDATSEVYSGNPKLVQAEALAQPVGLGQLASLCFRDCIKQADPEMGLSELLQVINSQVRSEYAGRGLPVDRPAEIGGLVGVVGKIDHERNLLSIRQWGDALFVVEKRDGSIDFGVNMVAGHDRDMYAKIAELSAQPGGFKWDDFAPFLAEKRAERINSSGPKGYPILNGQPAFLSAPLEYNVAFDQVRRLLVFTDGLVCGILEKVPMAELAAQLLIEYRRGELSAIFEATRSREAEKQGGHIKQAEITALALSF